MYAIGCHLSTTKGYASMIRDAVSIGANTCAFFLRNPRGGSVKALSQKDVMETNRLLKDHAFAPLVAHAPYILNPCAAKPELRELARDIMRDDLERLNHFPGNYYNFHPGCHVQQGAEKGIELTAQCLNDVLSPDIQSRVLVETMSGKGSEIGRNFEEIRQILDQVRLSDKVGVCLDTCHVWDGGYDIVSQLEDVLDAFDRIIGLKRLCAIHLNDSLNPRSSHKDRHANLDKGHIGYEALLRVVKHPKLQGIPFILETPGDLDIWKDEIARLRNGLGDR